MTYKSHAKYLPCFGGRLSYRNGEIGDTNPITLEIRFSKLVSSPDFTAGVTIEKNAAGQVIDSGTLQPDGKTVFYVINVAADINDVLTWAYSAAGGSIAGLGDVAAQTLTNYIGAHLYFDTADDSAHVVSLGV